MGNQGLCNKHYADHHCHCLPGQTNRFDQELNLAPLINPFSTTCIISINRLQHIDFDSACALHPDCDTRSQKGPEGIVGRGNGALVGLVFPSSLLCLAVSLSVSALIALPGSFLIPLHVPNHPLLMKPRKMTLQLGISKCLKRIIYTAG